MHLTRLQLDPRSGHARRDLADPYDMHRTLTRAFRGGKEGTAPLRFLWRLEPTHAWDRPVVLVQSTEAADWSFLIDLPGYLLEVDGLDSRTFELDALLKAGQRYRFRLLANPTVTREGKRHGLVGEDDQIAWFQRQGERMGFSVDVVLVGASDTLHARKSGMRLSLRRTLFEGVLVALDVEALGRAVAAGIGPGKAFGCGLLSVARCA